jgi:ribosomal protein S15P/S13E
MKKQLASNLFHTYKIADRDLQERAEADLNTYVIEGNQLQNLNRDLNANQLGSESRGVLLEHVQRTQPLQTYIDQRQKDWERWFINLALMLFKLCSCDRKK